MAVAAAESRAKTTQNTGRRNGSPYRDARRETRGACGGPDPGVLLEDEILRLLLDARDRDGDSLEPRENVRIEPLPLLQLRRDREAVLAGRQVSHHEAPLRIRAHGHDAARIEE